MANKKNMTKEELQAKASFGGSTDARSSEGTKSSYQTLDSGGSCFGESISGGSANEA